MNFRKWRTSDFLQFISSIEKVWNIKDCNTHLPFYSDDVREPQMNVSIGPVCQEVIRSKYRLRTDGIITKIKLKLPNRRHAFTNCFWKELSYDSTELSPLNEIYATMCASYLRHTRHIKSLAYCYGYVNGVLSFFTKERHASSVASIKNPTQYGFRVKKIKDPYALIERQNEPICLLSQEYLPFSFDEILMEWKENKLSDLEIRKHVKDMLLQICEGLCHMEKEWGIYHNDLHPGNIMARKHRETQDIEWCIIDWGRATVQREGCWKKNNVFTNKGPAYGHLRLGTYPLTPTSDKTKQFNAAVSGGDMVGFFVMLMKEEYIRRAVYSVYDTDPKWALYIDAITPKPLIKGDGLHLFRRSNEWARKSNLTLTTIKSLLFQL